MQIKQNSKHNNWLEILAGEDCRNSGERRLKFIASRETAKQREHRSAQRRKRRQHSDDKHVHAEAAKKYYNYTANETDEEREHRLPTLQKVLRRSGNALS